MNKIKVKKIREERDMFIIKCDECSKEIKGTAEKQVKYLLEQHKMAKHNKKLEDLKGGD